MTGFIIGSVVILIIILPHFPEGSILLINIPSYALWGFVGGGIGSIVNWIREKNIKLIIPFIAALILITAIAGYSINQSNINAQYKDSLGDQIYYLAFNDLIQPEADAFLNANANTTQQKITNLKKPKKDIRKWKT